MLTNGKLLDPLLKDCHAGASAGWIHRTYTVFNAKQIEGIPPHTSKERTSFESVGAGERILSSSGANIHHDQVDRCFYSRASDTIHLAPKEVFKDAPGYYGTALHELSHWTGHPSRLNRSTLNESYRFGDPTYAREELRAELASLFIAAETGIPHDPASHAAYVGSWVEALRKDNVVISYRNDKTQVRELRERSKTAELAR